MTRPIPTAPYLDSSEPILWQGRPELGLYAYDWISQFTVVGICFVAFSIMWLFEWVQTGSSIDIVFHVAILPFLAMGIWFVIGQPIRTILTHRQTGYTITPRRVIIMSEFPSPQTVSIDLRADIGFELLDEGQVGTIRFLQYQTDGRVIAKSKIKTIAHVPDAHQVMEILLNAQQDVA